MSTGPPPTHLNGFEDLLEDLLDDYFAECDEHLAILRRSLLALEDSVGQSPVDPAPLDAMLRSLHTLKGMSGMVGISEVEQLAHQMESYLRPLRQDQGQLTAEALDALLTGHRMVEQVLAARRAQAPVPNVAPALAQLVALGAPPPAAVVPAPAAALAPSDLSAETRARLEAARQRGQTVWRFEFTPSLALAERGVNVNSVRARLQQIGELIHAAPRSTPEGIAFEFLVAGGAAEDAWAAWREDGLSYAPYEPGLPVPPAPAPEDEGPLSAVPVRSLVPSNLVRVDLARLDELMWLVGELVLSRARLEDQLKRLGTHLPVPERRALRETSLAIERQLRELREGVMRVRLVPIGEVFERMQFVVRDLAREQGQQVALELSGQDTEVDKFVVERLMDPLLHLVRNALSHGLEPPEERVARGKPPTGTLTLRAAPAGDVVVIEVADDGRGLDEERIVQRARAQGWLEAGQPLDAAGLLELLCRPGFSTRDEADRASGRGVGLEVVKKAVQELGGTLALDTEPGRGTRFTIRLPLTLAIVDALIVEVGGQPFAVPLPTVREILRVEAPAVTAWEDHELIAYRGGALPLVSLARAFGLAVGPTAGRPAGATPATPPPARAFYALVIGQGPGAVGLAVDRLLGQREIVVRALTDPLVQIEGFAGATELGDGRAVLILDAPALSQWGRRERKK